MSDFERVCAVCSYKVGELSRCPECGQPTPPVRTQTLDDGGYVPEGTGEHLGSHGCTRKLVTKGQRSLLVAAVVPHRRAVLIAVGAGTLITLPWLMLLWPGASAPKWPLVVVVAIAATALLALFLGQWSSSQDPPSLTIDHAARTCTFNRGRTFTIDSILAIDYVRYNLRGPTNHTHVGLHRVAFDLGPDAHPRYHVVALHASNLDQVVQQVAQAIGVTLRVRKLGTLDGSDFSIGAD